MVLRWLIIVALVALLGIVVSAGTCGGGGSQYHEIGRGLGEIGQEGGVPGSYMYVVDVETMLYWPNQAKYVDAIPAERRVYVKDAETMAQFKGYEPGPL
jgi:hypothetical protein